MELEPCLGSLGVQVSPIRTSMIENVLWLFVDRASGEQDHGFDPSKGMMSYTRAQ